MKSVLVIGGANTDVVGVPDAPLVARDSNPGHVAVTAGGVGRNIAENLARLGVPVTLVTAFGEDANGRARRDECERAGIDVSRTIPAPGLPGPVYLAVLDADGDMAAAISDTRALDMVGPEQVVSALGGIPAPGALVLDANLGPATLRVARELLPDVPLFLECVSAAKASRLAGLVSGATAVHANVREAEVLVGLELEPTLAGAALGAQHLVGLGAVAAYVTAGAEGTAYASTEARGAIPAPRRAVVNATGAGDAFMAGIVAATLDGRDTSAAAAFATACAALTLASEHTVAPGLDRRAVETESEAVEW